MWAYIRNDVVESMKIRPRGEADRVSYRRTRPPQTPFLIGVEVAGTGWILVTWMIANTLAAAIIVVVGTALTVRACETCDRTGWSGGGSMAMDAMVGGTAGGFFGGIAAAILGIHGANTAMALMTASMAGMVGGTLGGWAAFR